MSSKSPKVLPVFLGIVFVGVTLRGNWIAPISTLITVSLILPTLQQKAFFNRS